MIFSLITKLRRCLAQLFGSSCKNEDQIHLDLDGLEIDLERCFNYDRPHEVSIFVPRAELRTKIEEADKVKETEILLNSITVVHSPYRPADDNEEPPEPPEIPRQKIE